MTVRATRARRRTRRPRWGWQQLLTAVVLVGGVAVLLYPTAADWFARRAHATEVSGYVDYAKSLPEQDRTSLLETAREFNKHIPVGPLRDPYQLNDEGQLIDQRDGLAAYERQLAAGPTGVMAQVQIPKVGVNLPVYHGTDEETLKHGAGHLYGSSLPVGGPSTHAVLTAHSGLPSAKLFTDLNQLKVGDLFSVTVLGESLYYAVDEIVVVEPDMGDHLRQVADQDLVTLITCTPTGVNTHRLLVRGIRTEAPAAEQNAAQSGTSFAPNASSPGFPWFAVALVGSAVLAYVLLRPRRRRTETSKSARPSPAARLAQKVNAG